MSEMVDRVAKAMMDQFQIIAGPQVKPDQNYWKVMAKLAIETMREPTNSMVDQFEWHKDQDSARFYWGWMIAEALK